MPVHGEDDVCSQLLTREQDSNESYDSEDIMLGKGPTTGMALHASGHLIKPERESLVNMGENTTKDNIREMRKMQQEIVEPNLADKGPVKLLPRAEETKAAATTANKRTIDRYAGPEEDGMDDDENVIGQGILPLTDS